MWSHAIGLFALCKVATLFWLRTEKRALSTIAGLQYLLGWVGMDARPFTSTRVTTKGQQIHIFPGVVKAILGFILLYLIAPLFAGLVSGWFGMIGLVLILHFGLFHLLAAYWNRRGIPVEPIMNRPLQSQSLAEFWGARWNRAFNELMFYFVFRPTAPRLGTIAATLIVFLVSGLIHDLALSVPARGGYGLPTAYFLFQGVALLLQRTPQARLAKLHTGWRGRFITFAVLVLPLPLLFHAPFIERVILPFLRVIGAAPVGGNYD